MSTVLEPLPAQLYEWDPEPPTRPLPSTHVTNDDDQFSLDQSSDRAGMHQLVDDEGRG